MNLRGRSFGGKVMGYQESVSDMTKNLQREVDEAQGYARQWLDQNRENLRLTATEMGQDVAQASMAPFASSHGEAVGESVWSQAKPWVIGGGVILIALVGYGVYKVKS